MIAAMMLPTTMPLLATFQRIVASRAGRGRLTALVVLGYFAAWLAFGLLPRTRRTRCCTWLAAAAPALAVYGWVVGAAVLAVAGCVPVQRAQVSLPRAMSRARLASSPRAGTAGRPRARRSGSASTHGRVLRRLLLGADAA